MKFSNPYADESLEQRERLYLWFRQQALWHSKQPSSVWHRSQTRWYRKHRDSLFGITDIVTMTIRKYSAELAENVLASNALLARLRRNNER